MPAARIHDFLGLRRLTTMNKCIRTKRLPFYPSTLYNRYNRYTLPLDPAQSAFITADPANIRRLMTDTKSYSPLHDLSIVSLTSQ